MVSLVNYVNLSEKKAPDEIFSVLCKDGGKKFHPEPVSNMNAILLIP